MRSDASAAESSNASGASVQQDTSQRIIFGQLARARPESFKPVTTETYPRKPLLDQEPLVDHGALRDVPRRVRLADQPDEVVQQEDEEDAQRGIAEPDVRHRKR